MAQDRFEELLGLVLDDDATEDHLDELFEIVIADAFKLVRKEFVGSRKVHQHHDLLFGALGRRFVQNVWADLTIIKVLFSTTVSRRTHHC